MWVALRTCAAKVPLGFTYPPSLSQSKHSTFNSLS